MESRHHILGLNSRNRYYLPYNTTRGRRIADSKLITKKILLKEGIPTPQLLAVLNSPAEVISFPWETLPGNFVLKPCSGFDG